MERLPLAPALGHVARRALPTALLCIPMPEVLAMQQQLRCSRLSVLSLLSYSVPVDCEICSDLPQDFPKLICPHLLGFSSYTPTSKNLSFRTLSNGFLGRSLLHYSSIVASCVASLARPVVLIDLFTCSVSTSPMFGVLAPLFFSCSPLYHCISEK